ncbi:MAG: hypothetical protein J7501_14505 [Bdellovibrio sp.]|nr:hypothetical protein [Bdellovibrio sp.]
MKFAALLTLLISFQCFAQDRWANSTPFTEASAVSEVFRKSAVDDSLGPDYTLQSGQIFSNGVVVSRAGKVIGEKDWIAKLKNGEFGTNTGDIELRASMVKVIKNVEDFQSYIQSLGVSVRNPEELRKAVADFLKPHPGVENPTIIFAKGNIRVFMLLGFCREGFQNAHVSLISFLK